MLTSNIQKLLSQFFANEIKCFHLLNPPLNSSISPEARRRNDVKERTNAGIKNLKTKNKNGSDILVKSFYNFF
jgi:hypothetical protein